MIGTFAPLLGTFGYGLSELDDPIRTRLPAVSAPEKGPYGPNRPAPATRQTT